MFRHPGQAKREATLERLHEARLTGEGLAGFDKSRDLGLKRRQGFAKAGDMSSEAPAYTGVTGVLQPVFLGEEHLLSLVAPGFQVLERQDLGRRLDIEVKIGGLQPKKGENTSVDRVGFGDEVEISGEAANPRSMGFARGDPELHAEIENMALIAAGRLADDEQRAEIGLGVASQFGDRDREKICVSMFNDPG